MKVISLNAWGGKAGTENLISFFKKYPDTDVFCLQEIFNGGEEFRGMKAARFTLDNFDSGLLDRISEALPNHKAFFRPHFEEIFGLLLLVRKDISVQEEGFIDIYQQKGYYSKENIADQHRILQYATFGESACTIAHAHGLWNGKGKLDCHERLLQSEKIVDFLKTLDGPHILLGDLNIRPDTQSIKILEESGLRNLIAEYGINTTRTSLYDSREKEPHANYAFVSDGIEVIDFKVLPDEVSDHAALYLEFTYS